MFRPAVLEIIPRHRRDHDVLEVHPVRGFGDALGFVEFECKRLGSSDRAEATGASAAIPGNHEGGSALAPTLPVIGALRAFAHRVQSEVAQQSCSLTEGVAGG